MEATPAQQLECQSVRKFKLFTGVRPLLRAACIGNHRIFDLLVRRGADIRLEDEQGMTALMYAAFAGRPLSLNLLMVELKKTSERFRQEVDDTPDYLLKECRDGFNALELATYYSRKECVRILCDFDHLELDASHWGPRPLHFACCEGNVNIAGEPLNHEFDINSLDLS